MENDHLASLTKIPLKSLILGTFESTQATFTIGNIEGFAISFDANELSIEIHVKLSHISSVDFKNDGKFVRLTMKPSGGKNLSSFVPEGFNYCFYKKGDESRFILNFCDNLEDDMKRQIGNFFSNIQPDIEQGCSPAKRSKLDCNGSERPKRNLRSRVKTQYIEEDSEDMEINQAILESLREVENNSNNSVKSKKTMNTSITPPRHDFDNFNDFETLFEYQDITVRMEDFKCLDRRELITNNALDFFLQYILNNKLTAEQRERVHIFSSNFYSMYSTVANFAGWKEDANKELTAQKKRYDRVKALLPAHVNIFDKDFLIFPCLDNEHWFLTVVCYPLLPQLAANDDNGATSEETRSEGKPVKSPMILCFDSVRGNPARRTKAIRFIRDYIESEYKEKHHEQFYFEKNNLLSCHVSSPQQKTVTDCGLFVMEFVEHFLFKKPITVFEKPMDCTNWFDPKSIESHEKRKEVASVMKSLIIGNIPLPSLSFEQNPSTEPRADKMDENNNDEKKNCHEDAQQEMDKTDHETMADEMPATESSEMPTESENEMQLESSDMPAEPSEAAVFPRELKATAEALDIQIASSGSEDEPILIDDD